MPICAVYCEWVENARAETQRAQRGKILKQGSPHPAKAGFAMTDRNSSVRTPCSTEMFVVSGGESKFVESKFVESRFVDNLQH